MNNITDYIIERLVINKNSLIKNEQTDIDDFLICVPFGLEIYNYVKFKYGFFVNNTSSPDCALIPKKDIDDLKSVIKYDCYAKLYEIPSSFTSIENLKENKLKLREVLSWNKPDMVLKA